jgi:glycine cleavage system T protein
MMVEANNQVINRSPLRDEEIALGAKFGVVHGWEMAECYTGASEEHLRVRADAGVIDLSYYGALKIGGGEAVQFLNGLVTNDVKALSEGKGMRAAFLTGHGRVKAFCRVLNIGKEFLVINDPQTHDKILKYVSPFSYAGDFKVEDVSEQYRTLSVQGPKANLIMKEVCFEPVPSLSEYDWFETLIAGHRALVSRTSHTGEPGFDVLVPSSALKDIWDFILLKGHFHSLIPFGFRALDSLRLEAGIPVYGVDIDESNMMLEAGLIDAVSFTKGCYTGQEAVAMATYRGHVSKRLSGLIVNSDSIPQPGSIVIKDAKEIGHVTSIVRSVSLGSTIALALLKYGFFEPGTTAEIATDNDNLPAVVTELPFYRPV